MLFHHLQSRKFEIFLLLTWIHIHQEQISYWWSQRKQCYLYEAELTHEGANGFVQSKGPVRSSRIMSLTGCRCSSRIIFLYVPHNDHRSQKLFWKNQKIKRGHEEDDLFFTYFWVFLNCINYRFKSLPFEWIKLRGMYFEREEVFFR